MTDISIGGTVREPDIAAVGSPAQPYVTWAEYDGTNFEIRVARFDGTGWQQVGAGGSPINRSATQDGVSPSITSVGGVLYVAWRARNDLVALDRIYARSFDGTSWGELETVNPSEGRNADSPSIASIGGVATWPGSRTTAPTGGRCQQENGRVLMAAARRREPPQPQPRSGWARARPDLGRRRAGRDLEGGRRDELRDPGLGLRRAADARLSIAVTAFSPSGRKGPPGPVKLAKPKKKKPARKK